MRFVLAILAALLFVAPNALNAQRMPQAGGLTTSLGQPRPWSVMVGGGAGLSFFPDETAGRAEWHIGAYREMISRSIGGGGVHVEAYNEVVNARFGAGLRARLMSQLTGIAIGADYNATH